MLCAKCGSDISVDMINAGICFNCGYSVSESEKIYDKELENKRNEIEKAKQDAIRIEKEKIEKDRILRLNNHMLTTGFCFESFTIKKYVGLVSGETVMGTGYISTIESSISDVFGVQSIEYSKKIKTAKEMALNEMIVESTEKGGNAIIGISYEIITFSRDLIGVSVNGTSVIIESI